MTSKHFKLFDILDVGPFLFLGTKRFSIIFSIIFPLLSYSSIVPVYFYLCPTENVNHLIEYLKIKKKKSQSRKLKIKNNQIKYNITNNKRRKNNEK